MTDEQKQIAEQAIRGAMAFGTGIVFNPLQPLSCKGLNTTKQWIPKFSMALKMGAFK